MRIRDMADLPDTQQLNQNLARQLQEEARQDPRSAYAGRFVGIANGQVVAVGDDMDQVAKSLALAEPDPSRAFFLEMGLDYDAAQEVWAR